MKKLITYFWGLLLPLCSLNAQSAEEQTRVTLDTTEGEIVLALYNETPLHRDHFVQKVKEGVYDGRDFNRVIEGFVVQCGEEEAEDVIPAEIRYPQLYHRRGVLAMERCTADPTHELKSASEQFYIAWGKSLDEKALQHADSLMQVRSYGRCQMDEEVRHYYQQHPGLPALDGSYTIFGEVIKGMEVVERIQAVPTNKQDRPLQAVTIRRATVQEPDPTVYWSQPAVYVDAYRLADSITPVIECRYDSLYTIRNWYGVSGHDVSFVLRTVADSTLIEVVEADSVKGNYSYVATGLPQLPTATIYPRPFVETNTLCSGFYGNRQKGRVWAYTYLYTPEGQWDGGHLYTLMWGEAPAKPIWRVQGHSTLVGNVPGLTSTLEAYADRRYILRDWYGVEKYDLEFRLRPDGGIELLDYYWTTETGERFVQCRREDISYAAIPQSADQPNGGLEGDAQSGKLHFRMTAHQNDDQPIADPAHPEFIFEW